MPRPKAIKSIAAAINRPTIPAERIDRALHWLGEPEVFTVQQNPHGRRALAITIISTASNASAGSPPGGSSATTIGIAKGRPLWSAPASSNSAANGKAPTRAIPNRDPNIATSFALLFLAKGRRPILMAKLQHGPGNDWNHHRSDVANLT